MATALLQVNNLSKVYDNGVQALKGVSFEVEKGEFLAVIGLSGSGKSTLIRCLNRLIDPTGGEIYFHGNDVTRVAGRELRDLRRRMGMVFQQFNLIKRHTVLKNVLSGRLAYTSTFKSIFGLFTPKDREHAKKYLEVVGLEDKTNVRADDLSGGQQQRVAIARTLMQNPDLILADEPVASLDPATSHSIMDHLEESNKKFGRTVICNLHFLSLVRRYATRVIALRGGEIVFRGNPSEIDDQWFKDIYGEEAKEVKIK